MLPCVHEQSLKWKFELAGMVSNSWIYLIYLHTCISKYELNKLLVWTSLTCLGLEDRCSSWELYGLSINYLHRHLWGSCIFILFGMTSFSKSISPIPYTSYMYREIIILWGLKYEEIKSESSYVNSQVLRKSYLTWRSISYKLLWWMDSQIIIYLPQTCVWGGGGGVKVIW